MILARECEEERTRSHYPHRVLVRLTAFFLICFPQMVFEIVYR